MFETPEGIIDISGYTQEQRESFFQKYPEARQLGEDEIEAQQIAIGLMADKTGEVTEQQSQDISAFIEETAETYGSEPQSVFFQERDQDRIISESEVISKFTKLKHGVDQGYTPYGMSGGTSNTGYGDDIPPIEEFENEDEYNKYLEWNSGKDPFAKPIDQQAVDFYEENDLNLDVSISNTYYNKGKENSFVNANYDVEKIKEIISDEDIKFNETDFQGYLNKIGFTEDFKKLPNSWDLLKNNPDIKGSKAETEADLEIYKQQELFSKLDSYISDLKTKKLAKEFYQQYSKNPSEYSNFDNIEDAKKYWLKNTKGLNSDEDFKISDDYKLRSYAQKEFPKLMEEQENIAELQLKHTKDREDENKAEYFLNLITGTTGAAVNRLKDETEDLVNSFAGIVGFDEYAAKSRATSSIERQRRVKRNLSYALVEGKSITTPNGTKYIKDKYSDAIYNTDTEIMITDEKEIAKINKLIEAKGVEDSDISFRGGLAMAGEVGTSILTQIIGTKGFTAARRAASAKYIKSVNSARKAKGLKPLSTRARDLATGKFIKGNTKGTFGRNIPVDARTIDATLFQSTYGAIQGYENTIKAAKEAGLSDAEAEKLASNASIRMALLYGATGPINPRIPAMNRLDSWLKTSGTIRDAINQYKKAGSQKAFNNYIKESVKKLIPSFSSTKQFIEEGAREVVQENIQQAGEIYGVNRAINNMAGVDILEKDYTSTNFKTTSVLSFATSGLISSAKLPSFKQNSHTRVQSLFALGSNIDKSRKILDLAVKVGKLKANEVEDIISQAQAVYSHGYKAPSWMLNNPEAFIEASIAEQNLNKIIRQKETSSEGYYSDFDDKIEKAKQKLSDIINKTAASEITEQTETIKKFTDKVESFDTPRQMVEFLQQKAEKEGKKYDFKAMMADARSDGFIVGDDGTIFINKQRAAETQAVSVASHELLHKVMRSEFTNNPEMNRIVEEFKQVLKNKGIYNKIDARMNVYRDAGIDVDNVENADEYFTAFSDLIAKNEISQQDLDEPILLELGRKIINIFKTRFGFKNARFETGQDVFDFIKNYQKNIKEGELTKQAKLKLEEFVPGETKRSLSILQNINNLVPKEVKTKQDFQDAKVFNPIYEATLPGGPIYNYVNSRSTSREEAEITLERVVDRLINFDPAAIRKTTSGDPITFGEFLFANARFSKLDAKKRLAIESERRAESLDTEEARQVAEPVAETTTTEAPRIEYQNLVEASVLPAEIVSKVKDKILLITKTLKSRIDAATSINKTVTPLMSEIKKEIGKQADIEFKKMLGAKRGGELRNNFLKLKKPILENMTTTWLMQGMPFAIQKSVDGKFTSNWEGKKIDRESVGTDKAGRTSGAQLVRRLPNAANRITDEQFLTYMFKGDEVIRGRKEALAKALAEEYAFDVYSQELYDGNSEVRKAFEDNQERLGVELSDNFVQEFNKQAERGNVKRSLSQTQTQEIGILTKAIYKKGYDNIIEEGVIIDDDLAKFSKESIDFISRVWDEGLIVDFGALGFLKGVKMSNVIPESIKEISKKAVTKVSSKQVKDALAKDSKKIAMKLGSDVINITGLDGVGFHNRILDPAATKKNKITKQLIPGATGEYFNVVSDINKNIKPSKNLPKNLDLSKVRLMNSSMGLMSKINTILNKDISAEEKQNQYKKYIPEIQEANIHNKILANHMITTMVGMVKSGEITPQSYVNILQLQTQAAKGLRALTGLKYITFKNGPQGKIKGEHLADNSTSMLEFAELAFSDLNENELNNSINDILEFHDQWLENKNTLDFVDVFGRNNPFKDKRINLLPSAQQKFVFTFDLMPASTLIDSRSKAIDDLVKIRKGQTEQAKIDIKQKALNNARKRSYSENPKGISVYDFDDTLAFSKSQIIVKKDGKTFKINAAQFAKQGETLLAEGAEFDFSEFNKVVKGKAGPLIPRIQKAIDKFGNNNIFILTARPVASETAIHAFMKGLGIDIPRANITGLANSTAQAKADWMVGKVAEGFNDFYFVDDAIKNVQAVRDVLETFDVNSKVQQAIANRKRSMSSDLNEMIERNKGVRAETTYSKVLARKKGAKKGKFKFFVPYSAEDFKGLTSYTLAGKGKQGEADQRFFDQNLILPYTRGIAAMEGATQALKNDYKNLLDMFGLKKQLPKKIGDTDFTTDQAVRVYLWDQQGFDIPNISKRDQNKLSSLVAKDPDLVGFAEGLMAVSKKDNWVNPKEHWDVGSILKDLNDITDNVNRKEYLAEFIENVDEMFDKTTLNKLEAIYGTNYVEALQDSIRRMKSGSNTPRSAGKIEQKWLNWVNNSVGTIMFFNRRSALLQMLSFTNFINWSDNNPAKAAAAFANQPLYWKKWAEIFNSDKLKERRGGLKSDIQESEIANQARNSKDKASAVISYLLKIGFTPTQIADSFAIATGGATFLINRTKKYEKQGLSKKEAEAKAFEDFGRISDETQQSGDPMLISQQQSSHLGRLILAFQNTPMQYTRLMKKAGKDIINRRGSDVENLSKIAYYGFVQNLIFSSLQSALFALIPGFDDEEEDDAKLEDKAIRTANSMVDTVLRGSGLAGAVISTLKNAIMRYQKEDKKAQERYGGGDQTYTMLELANISPPIGSKLRKVYSAIQTKKFNQAAIDEMGYDLTIDGKFNPSPNYEIIANISSAAVNLPADRLLSEVKSINEAFDSRNTSYQRLALALGWRTWDVNVKNEEQDLIKLKAKKAKKQKAKDKRKANKRNMSLEEKFKEKQERYISKFKVPK